ncbi:acetyl-CoA carboxylase biotin carboxyl carrier protein [Fangia hongkongensis]|uniref:acetyl-CoA carboxylase biotin carboxyl carrier protein n=1 Tax=Fangia hongkongensis TaxID=270495 RepID=UPI00036F442B|nr:acetyl-CoA carboxylase biotin carboxyl carrier protein [Fangia hongkongensis]MBK2124148.1 acetyl-CoA carboxylase biotin carboxyl carrier protein [Fangia hongkongensis]
MDIKKIEKLITLIENSNVNEIEIKEGETSIRITGNQVTPPAPVFAQAPAQQIYHTPMPAPEALATPVTSEAPAQENTESLPQGQQVKSPMVGTFYQSPSPGAGAFVSEGQVVNKGDTLCIIEAMKIMNQIEAESSGTVLKILVNDGAPVEFDQPLFIIG